MGAFDPLIKMICIVSYVIFVVLGLVVTVAGLWYVNDIDGGSDLVMFSLIGGGLGMFLVGLLALFGLNNHHGWIMAIVWLVDVVLFNIILVGALLGVMLGMDIQDPARHAVDESWAVPTWRANYWDTEYCHLNSRGSCLDFEALATDALGTEHNYDPAHSNRHLFADCEMAEEGYICPISDAAGDRGVCNAVDTVGGDAASRQAECEGITDGAGCAYTAAKDATCVGTDDGSGTCTGTATVFKTCDLLDTTDGSALCPGGCDSTAASTPECAFSVPGCNSLETCTGCPEGCAEQRGDAITCTGTADEIPATCAGTSTELLTCDLLLDTEAVATCPAGCDSTPGATCALNADASACAVAGGSCEFSAAEDNTCSVKPDCSARDTLRAACDKCSDDCREFLLDDVKDGMQPAAVALLITFAFSVICVIVNHYMVRHDPESGLVRKLAFFFNIVVTIMGLITTILAIVGQISVVDACPAESECTNHVAVGVIILGGLLILIGVLGVFGTWKNIHFFMTGANFVHSLVAFLTLVSGLFIGILSGYMDTINAKSEAGFVELRGQFEQKVPDYCQITDAEYSFEYDGTTYDAGTRIPMTDEDCRAKMREEIEGQMGVVGAVLIALAIFFLVVMYFTWKAWGMLSAQEDEEGFYEGGDQEGGDSLLDYAED